PALPAARPPPAERDPRRVGAALRGARRIQRDGGRARAQRRLAVRRPPRRRTPALARQLLRLARAGGLRRGARSANVADPCRAPLLLRDGDPAVVAAPPGRAEAARVRRARRVRVRGVRARGAARAPARAAAAPGLRLLRPRAPARLGP